MLNRGSGAVGRDVGVGDAIAHFAGHALVSQRGASTRVRPLAEAVGVPGPHPGPVDRVVRQVLEGGYSVCAAVGVFAPIRGVGRLVLHVVTGDGRAVHNLRGRPDDVQHSRGVDGRLGHPGCARRSRGEVNVHGVPLGRRVAVAAHILEDAGGDVHRQQAAGRRADVSLPEPLARFPAAPLPRRWTRSGQLR